jgi:hypothetical protein
MPAAGGTNNTASMALMQMQPSQLQQQGLANVTAVVSVACRFPGGAGSPAAEGPAAFWAQAISGGDAQSAIPLSKWDMDALYSPDQGAAAGGQLSCYARFAATLDGGCGEGASLAAFDAGAFRLTAAEAAQMDPQARLLLETAAGAFADATGRLETSPVDARTGVYVGCMWATGTFHLIFFKTYRLTDVAANALMNQAMLEQPIWFSLIPPRATLLQSLSSCCHTWACPTPPLPPPQATPSPSWSAACRTPLAYRQAVFAACSAYLPRRP